MEELVSITIIQERLHRTEKVIVGPFVYVKINISAEEKSNETEHHRNFQRLERSPLATTSLVGTKDRM